MSVHRSRYRRTRLRRHGSLTPLQTAAAVAAGLVVAWYAHSAHGPASHGATAADAVDAVAGLGVPSGSAYTPQSWAAALLSSGGWPRTGCNLAAVTGWEAAEGGNWDNSARFNPLDTTQAEPGSWPINSVDVMAYPSWAEGFAATLATLRNGRYGGILAALQAGDDAQAVADAVAGSPWGTGPFNAGC